MKTAPSHKSNLRPEIRRRANPVSMSAGFRRFGGIASLATALRLRAGTVKSAWGGPAGLFALANEGDLVGGGYEFIGNVAPVGADGWARVPYGEHPHDQGLQRFTKADAEEMVGYFKNAWNRLKRVVSGLNIYKGHPDHPAFANVHKDKASYGTVADMEARDDGLYLKPVVTPEGEALINSGLKYFSPHWLAKKVGEHGGKPIFAPVFMKSIGLTATPNIGGTSLVNSKKPMNPKLLALLAVLGRTVAADATEAQLNAELDAATGHANSLAARPEATALANEQTRVTELTTQLANANTKATEAATALANEQAAHKATVKARNLALVDSAIRAGKIVEANKAVWLGRLDTNFAVESVALANETGAIKTQPRTAHLGDRKAPSEAREQFAALVNEALPKHGDNYQAAWNAVKATATGKALLEKMDAAPTATT